MLITPAYAQAAAGSAAPGGAAAFFIQMMPLALIFIIFWFLLIRPQQQRAKQHRAMIDAVKKFRGPGDYTFLLESDDGRVRLRQKDGPVLTNPRLSSAVAFLEDIHLLSANGTTPAGLRCLAAA